MGWAAAPADPGCDRKAPRKHLAAAGIPAPIHPARHARDRQAGDQLPGLRALMQSRKKAAERSNGGTSVRTGVSACLSTALALAAWLFTLATASAYTVYITNEKDNTLSIIDSSKLEVIKTVKVGQRPRGVTLTKDHRWLLVCASDDNIVQVYDARTLEYVKSLPSGQDPEQFVLHPAGNPLYIANEEDNLVTVVDIEKDTVLSELPVGVEPEGMGISPDGKLLVATSETTNMAHFIDAATNKIIDNVLVDSRPRFAEFTADGAQVWVSAEIGGAVSVIDVNTRAVVAKIAFRIPGVPQGAIQPIDVRISRDGKRAFVALGPANRVAMIDAVTFKVEKYLLVGQRVWQLGFTPDEKLLFTTNGASNDVSVIDVERARVVRSIKDGRYPWGVVVAPF